MTMNDEAPDGRLASMLRAADSAFVPPAVPPIGLATLRRSVALSGWRRGSWVGIAAAIGLLTVLARPLLSPPEAAPPVVPSKEEIALLERQADSMRSAALAKLEERERPARLPSFGTTEAAAEKAAFLLYCEADRLAQSAETLAAAHERYASVAERFPGTIWARMASAQLTTSAPIQKG